MEELIRSELFSIERLEQHAESLAAAQRITRQFSESKVLLARLKENAKALRAGVQTILQNVEEERSITPAAEWLVDNFYVVEEQIREIIDDLPPSFYRRLPTLVDGPFKDTPRAYGLAWTFVAHTDSRFDPDWLRRFIRAYQKSVPLDIGEIWALAITLRIVLVENLRRLADHVTDSRIARQDADRLADDLLGLKRDHPVVSDVALRPFERSTLPRAFVVQLVQRLRDQEGRVAPAVRWLNDRLSAQNTSAEDIVRLEHQVQSAMNTTVRNVILSMKQITALDWTLFFEDVSVVDELLRSETRFARMDFPSRDLYRHAIEELSRGSDLSELEITRRAIRAAKTAPVVESADASTTDRTNDPGYYLISSGRAAFEEQTGFRLPLRRRFIRAYIRAATPCYLGGIAVLTALAVAVPWHWSRILGIPPVSLGFLTALALFPASDVAVALVNRWVTESLGPKVLPKLDFSDGVPPEFPTLLVMPILLSHSEAIEQALQHLEIHYLGNGQGHCQFALLSDWVDAPGESRPDDDGLLAAAVQGVQRLNEQYGPGADGTARFHLFHRRRLWNASEGVWMGWERKRGKLHELNQLLLGRGPTTYMTELLPEGQAPKHIRFVMTLDADTRMPRGAAYRLAGVLAHPLNRPRVDPLLRRVVEGYGIVQPRITPSLPILGAGSRFQKLYSGHAGMDPYAFAVSDVYQDLFREGSYIGKGIYDLEAFEQTLAGRVPENSMLSHDLFEGLFARTALTTDIEMYEEYPSHYAMAIMRTHRWVRGDWQLLPWIFGSPSTKSSISVIGRWKMLDNLRRSLGPPAALLLLLLPWVVPHAAPLVWMLFVLSAMVVPAFLSIVIESSRRRRQVTWTAHWQGILQDAEAALSRVILQMALLPHEARVMVDAAGRTLYRLFISHRRFLEWVTAAQSKRGLQLDLGSFYGRAAVIPLLGFVVILAYLFLPRVSWESVLIPLAALWLMAPAIAYAISVPLPDRETQPLSPDDREFFRLVARKTWRFFERFVTEEHHWLPPDNVQEIPQLVIAHRTSPTNIGLYLLSVVSARHFGWIGLPEMVQRLENTLATLAQMKRYQGHWLNWYDTLDLHALEPQYVSTVDSGNLAGHLWATAQSCQALSRQPLWADHLLRGIDDTLRAMDQAASEVIEDRRTETVTGVQLHDAIATVRQTLRSVPVRGLEWISCLDQLNAQAQVLFDIAQTIQNARRETETMPLLEWAKALVSQIQSYRQELHELGRWAESPLDQIADLGELSQDKVAHEHARRLVKRLLAVARTCETFVDEMRFEFLYEPTKMIFSIGFQVGHQKLDASYYDLLASEARLASFVAIAKGDVPTIHWFRLGRSLAPAGNGVALLSWSGSMFEYLMPSLVMHPPVGSLLDQTCRQVVRRQIAYGHEREVPWGVSESGFNAQDLEFTYQYSNFGVPGLGLKRGLSVDLLIAPYATALAAMVDPRGAAINFKRLSAAGAQGPYGYYESLDYTPTRLPENQKVAVVREFMAHHQGMSLVSFANVLCDSALRDAFHSEPRVRATELLLQERTPREVPIANVRTETSYGQVRSSVPLVLRRFHSPHDELPHTHLLSNGRYSVMLTAAGSGYSRWKDLAVTRWREDTTRDPWGTYIFLRDLPSGEVWSAGYQPTAVEPDSYEVDFSEERAEIVRRDGSIVTTIEVVVSPEDDAEIRRVSVKNLGSHRREIELTSYAEVVLATQAADAAHPAFSNLFVQTEFVAEVNGILCTRRKRSPEEADVWAAHVVSVDGQAIGELEYESDRARFLGRGRGIRTPMCVIDGHPLSNTAGPVIDPVISLRRRIAIDPGETVRVAFATMIASSREEAMTLADKYHDPTIFERIVTLAWTQAQIQQHHLGLTPSEAHLFQDLASRVLYLDSGLRPPPELLARNNGGQPNLWPFGISGDLPIVLVRIDEEDDRDIVREALRAHEYWRMKNLAVDLVILNEQAPTYAGDMQTTLENLARSNASTPDPASHVPKGSVHVIRLDRLSADDRILLQTAARVTLLSRHGTLSQQLERLEGPFNGSITPSASRLARVWPTAKTRAKSQTLQFFNGLGGFSDDGKEYVVTLGPGQWTPTPWVNVISNPLFGFQVSESGAGYTWSQNSRENQLTAWSNDPVSDPPSEVFYIRDEETGEVWTPTVLPIREEAWPYTIRHGQGYSRFEHESHEIAVELTQTVSLTDPFKVSRLVLTNRSSRTRHIEVTTYVEWVLGNSRQGSAPFIITEFDELLRAVCVRNPWNVEFKDRVAFADFGGTVQHWTCDRSEFIGRNGTLDHPAAMENREPLLQRVGAGWDPCAALRRSLEIEPNGRVELFFTVGQGQDRAHVAALISRSRTMDWAEHFQSVQTFWEANLEAVQVRTPDRSMDLMLNRWLLYQTQACRLWARAGFYQAGGAYGFRDQLQDVMALTVSRRDLAREQIFRAASRQFIEGDVQHWWHPPTGRGVRTKISDDRIWLAYVVNHYLEVTGEDSILDESIAFLEGPTIPPLQDDLYFHPTTSATKASLFEHCARALDISLAVGPHGLPLIGSGDWNDGMNRVGIHGQGESVWLAWFLHTVLWEFAKIAERRGDKQRAETWRLHVGELKAAIERNAWDGEWYRRAYFDDGTPLGSASNSECQIDSIAQSWGVLSGAADPSRAHRAMAALDERLVQRADQLVLLLTPPFDKMVPNPGYIQGYLPGVRENGGQYSHAAVWSILAFAALGQGDKAMELFQMINPIRHGRTRVEIHRYKVEPYVMSGDVYAQSPHAGRGGWSWYTGSAGWMYRAGIEWILGFRLRGTSLFMDPCIPKEWPGFHLEFRYHAARYEVDVENPKQVSKGIQSVEVDGKFVRSDAAILLHDDKNVHYIKIVLGPTS